MKFKRILLTSATIWMLGFNVMAATPATDAKIAPERCEKNGAATQSHDCAKHCAEQPGKDSQICAEHCAKSDTQANHDCKTHCSDHGTACVEHCSGNASEHDCAKHCAETAK